MTKNLTQGHPLKLMITFSIPILIGNLIQQFYHLVDSIFVSQFISLSAFSGVNVASFLIFLVFGFVFGMCTGCSIILAQRFGAKSKPGIKLSIVNAIYVYIFITISLTIISLVTLDPVLNLMGTPAEIKLHAKTYAAINFIGIFAVAAYNLFSQILRAIGDNLAALFFLIISAILNIILDFLAIAVLNLGVSGTAIATITSQIISAAACIIYTFTKYKFTRPEKIYWNFKKTFFFKQLQIGFPIALECSVCAVGLLILQKAVNKLGPNIIAGFAIAMRIEDLIITVFFAIASAAAVFTAQNLGAKQFKRIQYGTRSAMLLCFLTCIIFSIIFLLWWDTFVKFFINRTEQLSENVMYVKLAARTYINIVLIHYIILGALIILRNIVQSLGKTLIPMCGGFAELIARTFGAIILTKLFHYNGICFATILAWWSAFILVICAYFYYTHKFKKKYYQKIK